MSIYAVNGKEPVAAWIPSLDTAGNGTTTLTDLVGSNHGTLTNMYPATDWVADADAGGDWALGFDGANDYVATGFNPFTAIGNENDWCVAFWMLQASAKNNARIVGNSLNPRWYIATTNSVVFWGFGDKFNLSTGLTISFSSWMHVVVQYDSLAGQVQNYLNGVNSANNNYTGTAAFNDSVSQIGDLLASSLPFNGRLDDIRIWDQALDAIDVADLYASGLGRGITFGTGNPTGNLLNNLRTVRHQL